MAGLVYLDASALVKLVLPEAESAALLDYIVGRHDRVTSEISAVELIRAARRATDDPAAERRARQVIAAIHLLRLDEATLDAAAAAAPTRLRTVDAIHLTAALGLGSDLEAMIVYDSALADAARDAEIEVKAPGA